MKISLNWLNEYVKLPESLALEEIVQRLTFAGFEVEAVKALGKGLEKVVVGQILERKQHPNADRLSLCTINTGSEELQIVCGAQNIKAGQKIPVALVGALLPNGIEIKAAKIRGVASSGSSTPELRAKSGSETSIDKSAYRCDWASWDRKIASSGVNSGQRGVPR